ncbi:4Fe-4S binding protein [Eubacteriales bacterium OttesenSCG-928-N13]|nr:4Fe-4S binding protein [Eubacteriales bacterium OttesenSCG-928-N13]
MAKRKIIQIDDGKCNGCGLCAKACHEGAIGMVNGKAKLLRDGYCDGLGDCLPVCPTNAISFVEREAAEYDEAAVKENMKKTGKVPPMSGCPGSHAHVINHEDSLPCGCPGSNSKAIDRKTEIRNAATACEMESRLSQWPVQIKLVPVNAPYFRGARLLIAADCTAFAYGDFHERFIKNHVTLIGCPKLDAGDYSEKLTAIIKENDIKSVTVVRMEVPCCGGIANAAINALQNSGKMIPWQIVTISTDGKIIDE